MLQHEVTGIDALKRLARLKQYSVPYDFLVLVTGIQYNYFGRDEWQRVAPGLESLDDADLIPPRSSAPRKWPRSIRARRNASGGC